MRFFPFKYRDDVCHTELFEECLYLQYFLKEDNAVFENLFYKNEESDQEQGETEGKRVNINNIVENKLQKNKLLKDGDDSVQSLNAYQALNFKAL